MEEKFREFLDWVAKEAIVGSLDGDLLTKMASYWETWQTHDLTAATAARQAARDLQRDATAQRAFLAWLQTQPEFQDHRWQIAVYQLVQCKCFRDWIALDEYRTLSDDWKKNGVYAAFVLDGHQDAASVNKITAALMSLSNEQHSPPKTHVKLRPANFEARDGAKEALEISVEAVQHLLRFWPSMFLFLAFLLGHSSLLVTIPRAIRAIALRRRLRQLLQHSDCYALLDIQTGSVVRGESLGMAAALALLLAGIKACFDDRHPHSAGAYVEFVNRSFPRLAASGFTGVIRKAGSVEDVDQNGVKKKIEAMAEHPEIKRGVLPEENFAALQGKVNLELCGVRSLMGVFLYLMQLRFTSVFGNLILFGALSWGFWHLPGFADRYLAAPPDWESIQTGWGQFGLAYALKEDIPVRQLDRITLHIVHPRHDGRTFVQVIAGSRYGQDIRFECLQNHTEREDWHPEVTLPVENGRAIFDYQYRTTPCPDDQIRENQIVRESFTVIITRNGRVIRQYPLTFVVK